MKKMIVVGVAICAALCADVRAEPSFVICGQSTSPDTTEITCADAAGAALKDIGQLARLRRITLKRPQADLDLAPLSALPTLEAMTIDADRSGPPFELKRLGTLNKLKGLQVGPNVELQGIKGMPHLVSVRLTSEAPMSLAPLSDLAELRSLSIEGGIERRPVALTGAEHLPKSIENLEVRGATIRPGFCFEGFLSLKSLEVASPVDLGCLSRLPGLGLISLPADEIGAFASGFDRLWAVNLITQATDLTPIVALKTLTSVGLTAPLAKNFEILGKITRMKSLYIADSMNLTDISWLKHLKELTSVRLPRTSVGDISVLAGLTELEWVDLSETRVGHIDALSALPKLATADLSGLRLASLAPLYDCKALASVDLVSATFLAEELAKLKSVVPDLNVFVHGF